jgi:cytidylate kinase
MGLQAEILEGVDEKQKGWIRECLEGLLPGKEVSDPAFVHRLLKAVATLAARGQCVIVGRGATQVLPPASTLRVRLVAPRADRIAAIQARRGLSRAEAEKWVDRTDAERTRFVRDHFHHDPGEAHRYDLVLNTARLGIPACAEMIVSALRRLQAAAVPANAAG